MGGTVYGGVVIKDCNNISDKRLHMKGTSSHKHFPYQVFFSSLTLTHFLYQYLISQTQSKHKNCIPSPKPTFPFFYGIGRTSTASLGILQSISCLLECSGGKLGKSANIMWRRCLQKTGKLGCGGLSCLSFIVSEHNSTLRVFMLFW